MFFKSRIRKSKSWSAPIRQTVRYLFPCLFVSFSFLFYPRIFNSSYLVISLSLFISVPLYFTSFHLSYFSCLF
ncbi:unnamed protein product [Brugia timori]|uniref:Uncharacterized protein n=1 Tax=Brugia timori TaxID=42155 RepID=A0A0R3RBG2_9BILA|nr:unnamed protein product [Brugia timori]